jgi:cleavage and polyadenylation specificity factor subunit 2
MFTFTPLLGAQSTSNASQSILELDGGIKILIGTGWDEAFDPRQLVDLEKSALLPSFHSRKMKAWKY